MIQIQVDEVLIKQMYQDAIQEKVDSIDKELIFWDTKELKRRTSLSWNTIQDNFFYHKDFPKVKLAGKWLYPAKETQEFLEKWLREKQELMS